MSILLTSKPVSASTRKLAAGSSLQHANAKSSLDCTKGTTFTIRRTFWDIPYQKVIRLSLKSVRTTTHSVLFDHTPWSFQHALTWVDSWPPPQTQPKTATPPTTAITGCKRRRYQFKNREDNTAQLTQIPAAYRGHTDLRHGRKFNIHTHNQHQYPKITLIQTFY